MNLTLQNNVLRQILLIWAAQFIFSPINAQLSINASSTLSQCSATGTITIEVSGGKEPYCYDLSPCNNCYTCINQNKITYNALESGQYYITVTDNSSPAQIIHDTINVDGNYMAPIVYTKVNSCMLTTVVEEGKRPFLYAISKDDGLTYSPYQTDSTFSPVKGKYCVKVLDSCGNFTTYCSEIIYNKPSFTATCDSGKVTFCIGNIRLLVNEPGVKPYKSFYLNNDKDTILNDVNLFVPNKTLCPPLSCYWKLNLIDACDDTATYTISCTDLNLKSICHDCKNKTSLIYAENGVKPYKYYYYTTTDLTLKPNPNGLDTGYYSGLDDFDYTIFRVIDSCGNFVDLSPGCISALYKFDCDSNATILQVSSSSPPPFTYVCESCNPKITINDTIGVFKNINHPANFTVYDKCNNSMIINELLPSLETTSSCGKINSSMVYNVESIGGPVIIENTLGGLYKLFDNNKQLVDSNSTGNFKDLKKGDYTIEYECPGIGKLSKLVEMVPEYIRMVAATSAKLDSSGKCIPMYIMNTYTTDRCYITDLTTGVKELMNGQLIGSFRGYSFLEVEKPYRIQLGQDCIDTIIQLPKFDYNLDVILPECPNDGNLVLTGANNQKFWKEWGLLNTQIPISNKRSDFYTFDCIYDQYDLSHICEPDSFGIYKNLIPGSKHIAYLYINRDAFKYFNVSYYGDICPIDTLEFIFKPKNYKPIDSIGIDYISCKGSGLINIHFNNGVPPFNTKIINCSDNSLLFDTITNNQNFNIKNFSSGEYCFQFIDGCGNSIDYKKSVISPPDFKSFQTLINCDSSQFQFKATTFDGATYNWINKSDNQSFASGINLNTSYYYLKNNNDTIFLTIDLDGCLLFQDTLILTKPTLPNFSFQTLPINQCKHALTYNKNNVKEPSSVLWSNGSVHDTITNLNNGNYTLILTDSIGCSTTKSINLNVDTPIITILDKIIDCKANLYSSISNGNPPYYIVWSDSSHSDSIINLNDGLYNITVTDANGCISKNYTNVLIPKFETTIVATDVDSCKKNLSTLISSGTAINPFKYNWNNNEITSKILVHESNFYSVTVIDSRGCLAIDTIFINTNSPTITIEKLGRKDCQYGSVIHASQGQKPYKIIWSDNYTGPDTIRFMANGNYKVTIVDAVGCSDTATFYNGDTTITSFEIYNAISPNGDTYNQKFHIQGIDEFPENEVIIYNRWGHEVYKKKNYTNQKGWEGKFVDEPLPDGTYFYYINIECIGQIYTGFIEVQR